YVSTGDILLYTALFSFIVGSVPIAIAFYQIRRDMKRGVLKTPTPEEAANFSTNEAASENASPQAKTPKQGKYAKLFAILVPVVLLIVVSIMIFRAIFDRENVISGGDAPGFLGETALILLLFSTFGHKVLKGF